MKKWVLFFLIVCLCLSYIILKPLFESTMRIQITEQNEADIEELERIPGSIKEIEITNGQIYQGNLLLVNSDYPVHEDSIKSDIINLNSHEDLSKNYGLLYSNVNLSEELERRFSEMVAAAGKEEVSNFFVTSGFRDLDEQNALYEEMGSAFALPAGNSEHNLGLSLDVGSTQMKMEEAPEGKWIEKNAWKYGFVLRYPKDKVDITGIQYEPWHIRYVGLPHSAIMKEKNFVLEEYLAYLKEVKQISVSIQGKEYSVFYHSVSKNRVINVTENRNYEISGNNMDGVILTVFE